MTPKKPDLYKRAQGYGRLADIKRRNDAELDWRPVPGFPEYEVNKNRQVRRKTTQHNVQPYRYMMRPNEGEFVDFWINSQKIVVHLDAIMTAAFPKEEKAN